MSKRLDKAIEVAKATMMGDLRDVCLDIFKHPNIKGKAWKDMTEAEQREIAGMIENKSREAVVRAIDIIASEGRKHIKVLLKQVTVKDGLKGAFECSKAHELRHDLIDAQGDNVLIVFTSTDKYLGESRRVKFDKDQPSLPATETEESNEKENIDANETPHDPETGEVIEEDAGEEAEDDFDDTEEGDEDFDDEEDID